MKPQKIILAIGIVIISINPCITAGQQSEGTGKLTGSSETSEISKSKNVLLADSVTDFIGPKRPNCDPKSLGIKPIEELMNGPGIKSSYDLGIIFSPAEKSVLLHKLALQINSGGKVVFKTQAECRGCNKTYKPVMTKGDAGGYLFVLDNRAAKAAAKFFVAGNQVELIGSGHDGGPVSLYFTKVNKK